MTIENIQESVSYLISEGIQDPEIGIILGSGLGQLVDHLEVMKVVHYNQIPFFPISTVEFHQGKLILGKLSNKTVLVMQGRFHLYEGYDLLEITYPIRVMHALGIKKLIVSNAAGAINPSYKKGDILLIDDHINLQGDSPLAFAEVSEFGERFVDMSAPYDKNMGQVLSAIAELHGIMLHHGVYAAVMGPQLETRAEYRYLRTIGSDAVGMSTVPEVIVANQLKIPVIALSILTDECDPDNLRPVSVSEILKIAAEAEPKMVLLLKELLNKI